MGPAPAPGFSVLSARFQLLGRLLDSGIVVSLLDSGIVVSLLDSGIVGSRRGGPVKEIRKTENPLPRAELAGFPGFRRLTRDFRNRRLTRDSVFQHIFS